MNKYVNNKLQFPTRGTLRHNKNDIFLYNIHLFLVHNALTHIKSSSKEFKKGVLIVLRIVMLFGLLVGSKTLDKLGFVVK